MKMEKNYFYYFFFLKICILITLENLKFLKRFNFQFLLIFNIIIIIMIVYIIILYYLIYKYYILINNTYNYTHHVPKIKHLISWSKQTTFEHLYEICRLHCLKLHTYVIWHYFELNNWTWLQLTKQQCIQMIGMKYSYLRSPGYEFVPFSKHAPQLKSCIYNSPFVVIDLLYFCCFITTKKNSFPPSNAEF